MTPGDYWKSPDDQSLTSSDNLISDGARQPVVPQGRYVDGASADHRQITETHLSDGFRDNNTFLQQFNSDTDCFMVSAHY